MAGGDIRAPENKKTMRQPKYLLTLLTALCLAAAAAAQPSFRVRTFNIRDGLAANFISGMCQTGDGLVWVSTWNGLSCYDGYQFTTFRGQPWSGGGLTTNRIIKIEANESDNVWCVTFDRNLYLFDTHECRFIDVGEVVRQKYGMSIPARNIYALKSGVTWVTCDREVEALLRIDDSQTLDAGAVQLIRFDELGLDCNYVNKVVEDRDHREWILTDKGVALWGGALHIPQHYEYVEQLGQRVYMAAPDGRLGFWQPGQQRLTPVQGDSRSVQGGISALVGDGGERLLMATDRGVMAIGRDGRVATLSSTPATDLFTDSKRRIWAFGADRTVLLINDLAAGAASALCCPPVGWGQPRSRGNCQYADAVGTQLPSAMGGRQGGDGVDGLCRQPVVPLRRDAPGDTVRPRTSACGGRPCASPRRFVGH